MKTTIELLTKLSELNEKRPVFSDEGATHFLRRVCDVEYHVAERCVIMWRRDSERCEVIVRKAKEIEQLLFDFEIDGQFTGINGKIIRHELFIKNMINQLEELV